LACHCGTLLPPANSGITVNINARHSGRIRGLIIDHFNLIDPHLVYGYTVLL
jgi:hypothetical protein